MSNYLFISSRLGFRKWKDSDLNVLAEICADKEVMEHFPSTLSREQSAELITKTQRVFNEYGYCYYAVEILNSKELIGFIGISKQDYDVGVGIPFIDIGWRLKKSAWNKGYASEGAKKCLENAFEVLHIPTIYSIAIEKNVKSIHIMEKIGMKKLHNFEHPLLGSFPNFKSCVLYKIDRHNYHK